jgi:predicted Rossmann fold nucleotide-binding protein DprA/Smf involved in DNA uptake
MLKETADAPVVLYVKGDPQPRTDTQSGLSGSRRPSPYGISVAEKLSE